MKLLRILPALALLACGGGESPTEPPPAPVPTSLALSVTELRFDALGSTAEIVAVVQDQTGQAMQGVRVAWSSADVTVAFAGSGGVVTARGNGQTTLTATSGTLSAEVAVTVEQVAATFSLTPDSVTLPWTGAALPLSARVLDALAYRVEDPQITWGTTDAGIVAVDGDGTITAVTAGTAQVHGSVDSATDTVLVRVTDSPLEGFQISAVAPSVLLEGDLATVQGEGFGDAPEFHQVWLGEDPVEVVTASASELTLRIPESACLPTRLATLRIDGFGASAAQEVPVQPQVEDAPAVGEGIFDRDCIRLRGAPEGARFVVGLVSTSQAPSSVKQVRLTTVAGNDVATTTAARADTGPRTFRAPRPAATGVLAPTRITAGPSAPPGDADPWSWRHAEDEARIREAEREAFGRLGPPVFPQAVQAAGPAPAPPSQGDTVRISVPTGCNDGSFIRTVARFVGEGLVFLEDVENPVLDVLPQETMQTLDGLFTEAMSPVLSGYFGPMPDLDVNSRLMVVMTRKVNEREGVNGFVWGLDLYPKTVCSSSNEGELFYGLAADPEGTLGRQVSVDRILEIYPTLIAHEATHVVQLARQYFEGAGGKTSWEIEGGATLAEQLVGFRVQGHGAGTNLGWAEIEAATPPGWFNDWWRDMTYYFGYRSGGQVAGAPEQCSWSGRASEGNDGPCWNGRAPYGVPSTFLRMILDLYGDSYPGGESALMRALTGSPELGIDNVSTITGVSPQELVVHFSAALWADDRVGDWIPSWNVADVFGNLPEERQLQSYASPLAEPILQTRVRALSTAYLEWSPPGMPPPSALRLTDSEGGPAPPQTLLWVLRVQ